MSGNAPLLLCADGGADTATRHGYRPDYIVGDLDSAGKAAALLEKSTGANEVVLKLGERGALFKDNGRYELAEAYQVEVVDTTAAGDSFTAALALEHSRGAGIAKAVRRALAAGALAVTRLGAQPSLPTAEEVDRLQGITP